MSATATPGDNLRIKFMSRHLAERLSMLQWKPRFYAVLALAALAVGVFGGYAGQSAGGTLRQFGW